MRPYSVGGLIFGTVIHCRPFLAWVACPAKRGMYLFLTRSSDQTQTMNCEKKIGQGDIDDVKEVSKSNHH